MGSGSLWTKHYGLSGDTTINSQLYSKLYGINHYNDNYKDVDHFILDSSEYVGAIREDSGKKVYFLTADSSAEILLYDFGLEVGDTFFYEMSDGNTILPLVVIDMNSMVLVDGSYRTVFYLFGGVAGTSWIEGIGNSLGWFELPYFGTFEPFLMCFTQGGQYLFGSPGNCSCTPTSWISVEPLLASGLQLSPNPVSDKLTVQVPRSTTDATVYNGFGQSVFRTQVVQENQMTIDVSWLSNGVYFLILNGPESSLRKTFVKQ